MRKTIIVEMFEILEAPADVIEDQYFLMYTLSEMERFNPEQIFGVWGADRVASIMSRFRQTGILLKPCMEYPVEGAYEVVEGVVAVYVLKPGAIMHRVPHYTYMTPSEFEAHEQRQAEIRKNIEKYRHEEM